MGWYDAFKGNTARVNMSGVTSDAGSGAKNFGDAFVDFGKSMRDVEGERAKQELLSSKTALAENELAEIEATKKQNTLDDAFKKDFNTTSDIAYQKSLLEFEKPDGDFDSNVSSDAFKYAQSKIVADEKVAQGKFNDEAIESSVVGDYADMNSFVADNDVLVKNADGATMAKIDKYFSDKNNALAKLNAKEKDIKHATALLKAQGKNGGGDKLNKDLIDLQNSIAKEYGTYNKATGLYVIDKKNKDEASFALEYGTNLLNNGSKSLAKIRSNTKLKYKEYIDKKEKDKAEKSKPSWKNYQN